MSQLSSSIIEGTAMDLKVLKKSLSDAPNGVIQFKVPGRNFIPDHFHVTEVARVQKDFVDCGGTLRSEAACVLQIWVADDLEHRLSTDKLARILDSAVGVLKSDDLPVQVEYESDTISRFLVSSANVEESTVVLQLAALHTGCLAPDRCGLSVLPVVGCETTGCC